MDALERKNIEVIEEAINKRIQDFVDRIFMYSQENLVEDGKVDTGNLLKTANVNRGHLWAEIVYPAPYASNVHEGRLAGTMPPTEPIALWAHRKLGLSAAEAQKVAWAIAITIKERGIQPSPYLDKAINKAVAEEGA